MNDNSMFILFAVCFLYFILHRSPFPYALYLFHTIQNNTIRYDSEEEKQKERKCQCSMHVYTIRIHGLWYFALHFRSKINFIR